MPDYCKAGEVLPIPGKRGLWQRQPDGVRYKYAEARTKCPICGQLDGGVPWLGWFWCEYRGCCIALVDTGEVFVRVSDDLLR